MPRELAPVNSAWEFWTVYQMDHIERCVEKRQLWALKLNQHDDWHRPCDDDQRASCNSAHRCLKIGDATDGEAIIALQECHKVRIDQYSFVREVPDRVPQTGL